MEQQPSFDVPVNILYHTYQHRMLPIVLHVLKEGTLTHEHLEMHGIHIPVSSDILVLKYQAISSCIRPILYMIEYYIYDVQYLKKITFTMTH